MLFNIRPGSIVKTPNEQLAIVEQCNDVIVVVRYPGTNLRDRFEPGHLYVPEEVDDGLEPEIHQGCSQPYHCPCGCGAHMGCYIYDFGEGQ